MSAEKLPKPIDGRLSIESTRDDVAAEFDMKLIPLIIHGGLITAAGALRLPNGAPAGDITMRGIPAEHWPQSKPAGRPMEKEKHMAVFLAWFAAALRWGEKYNEADAEIARQFGYSEPKKVRDIRQKQAKKLRIDIGKKSRNVFYVADADIPEGSGMTALIFKPTWYRNASGFEVLGHGHAWGDVSGEKVASGVIKVSCPDDIDDAEYMKLRGTEGPIIISIIKPGRK